MTEKLRVILALLGDQLPDKAVFKLSKLFEDDENPMSRVLSLLSEKKWGNELIGMIMGIYGDDDFSKIKRALKRQFKQECALIVKFAFEQRLCWLEVGGKKVLLILDQVHDPLLEGISLVTKAPNLDPLLIAVKDVVPQKRNLAKVPLLGQIEPSTGFVVHGGEERIVCWFCSDLAVRGDVPVFKIEKIAP